jgi:hypothetical protein
MATVDQTDPNEELTGEEKHYQDLLAAGLVSEDDGKPVEAAPEGEESAPEAEPAAEPVKAEKAPESPDTPAEAAAAEEFFPGYANLPEASKAIVRSNMEAARQIDEYRNLAGKAEADRRNLHNRIAPTQRELEEAKKKLREFEQKQTTASRSGARGVLERFRKQYPEEAEAIDAVNSQFETFAEQSSREKAALLERLEALEGNVQLQRAEIERTKQYEQEVATLRAEHPDYLDIDANPEFKTWLQAVGEDAMSLLRNGKASSTAFVLSNFKRDREYARVLQAQGAAPPTTPATKPLARSVADPNPTARRTTAIPRSNSTAGLTGEDLHVANLQAAGYDI